MQGAATSFATRLFRLIRLALHIFHGVLTAATVLDRMEQGRRQEVILRWSRQLLDILKVRTTLHGQLPSPGQRGTLFVANHVSWLDIYALKATHPMHFVAKSEIRGWPVVGWLAHITDTIFIERDRRHATGQAVTALEQALRQGECLCFFPEGTTTDGTQLKPFKASLLQAAINAEAALWPLAIRYLNADGSANTAVAYHGEMTMLQSLWEVLKQRETRVELHFAAPISATGGERRHLSQQARHAISSLLHLPRHKAPGTHDGPPGASR
ncbi:MAG TPA: lysophospholipid acyltransferase family protein [Methylophilaceae bacterium]|nr:lysophospholipid acyltransferase family protein [Methylophilaceae bacterium]HQR60422.1 lysophospholipid acyltransferase family protein [Methylophilaceae bacterium]